MEKNICGCCVSIIFYTRDSVTQYFRRNNETDGQVIEYSISVYKLFSNSRHVISSLIDDLVSQKATEVVLDVKFHQFNCHMNPAVHLSPVIHYTVLLAFKYSLLY